MSPSRADDEVFCQSCGEPIKQKAEICPECGVRNEISSQTATATPSNQRSAQSSTRQSTTTGAYETEPSDRWVMGLKISVVIWGVIGVLLLFIWRLVEFGAGPGRLLRGVGLAALLPLLQIVGWALLGMSMYGDVKYVDYHTDEWPLNGTLYIAGAIILPILTQIIGGIGVIAGTGGTFIAPLIPVIIIVMCIRHLRTRSRVLPREAQ